MVGMSAALPAIIILGVVVLGCLLGCCLYRDLTSKPRVPPPGVQLRKTHPMEVERFQKKREAQLRKKLHQALDSIDLEAQKDGSTKDGSKKDGGKKDSPSLRK